MVPRSMVVDLGSCEGCGAPFDSADRSTLRPVLLRSFPYRAGPTFSVECSCGRAAVVVDGGERGLARVPDEIILATDTTARAH